MAVDGQSAEFIRDVLTEEVDAMSERHQSGALIFTQAGTYAPTLGVLGAVVGLIAALANMGDIEALDMQSVQPSLPHCLGFLQGMCYGIHLPTS